MQSIHTVLLATHVAAGIAALLGGVGAIITRKGAIWHLRSGTVYFWAMAWVAFSALPLAVIRPNLFLFAVAIFSFYLAFSGYRIVLRKRQGTPNQASALDWSGIVLMMVTGLGLLGYGVYEFIGGSSMYIPAIVFGVLGIFLALGEVREFGTPATDKNEWLLGHMTRMLAAYIATFTAFAVTNLTFLPPLMRWILPTVLGTAGLVFWKRRYERKLKPSKAAKPSE